MDYSYFNAGHQQPYDHFMGMTAHPFPHTGVEQPPPPPPEAMHTSVGAAKAV